MKSTICAGVFGLLSLLVTGCSSDAATDGSGGASSAGAPSTAGSSAAGASGSGQAGSSSVDPTDCAAVGAQQKSRITALGCKDTSGEIQEGCELLYSASVCVPQWEALIRCITPKPNSDFECGASDNELDPKTGVCTSERTAFDGCLGD
jgi:hypothetical protein